MRHYNLMDQILGEIDLIIQTLAPLEDRSSKRESPAKKVKNQPLNKSQQHHVAGLMRVNHSGEICAQGLYQGQALTATEAHVKNQMANAADEENDHLAWCEERLREVESQPSVLNPFWYLGSLMLGALAGLAGDRISLGFVAETEFQVSAHLKKHLNLLPVQDEKSRQILEQMIKDESHHAEVAKQAGGIELPTIIKKLMSGASKVMTKTSYYI